jgi:hypothetical protein
VRRALAAVLGGAVGKDTVSRVWHKVKSDWNAWHARSLAEEPIVRLILEAPWFGSGSTGRLPQSCFWSCSVDYNDMIYAASAAEVEERRGAFMRKWRLKCKAVANSLEPAGERLFTFTRLPLSQWRSARTTNAIERLHEAFKRRIKPRRCRLRPRPQPCCSGRCSPLVRLQYAKPTGGRP